MTLNCHCANIHGAMTGFPTGFWHYVHASSCQWIVKLLINWAKDPVQGILTKITRRGFSIFIIFGAHTCMYMLMLCKKIELSPI